MEKVLLIILDGLSDRPIKALADKTPLEAASTPNLDKLAKQGMTGLMHTVDIGVRPGSDVAHLSLLGYDPNVYYTGRGPFEAAGVSIKLKKEDVAMRGNFATVDSKWQIINRRAGRIDDTQDLIDAISGMTIEDTTILLKRGTGHRLAVVLQGRGLSGKITDSDPKKEGKKVLSILPLEESKAAKKTARVMNTFTKKSYRLLCQHPRNRERGRERLLPANMILLRGAGQMDEFPSFKSRYGLEAVCIAGARMYQGIGRILGMRVLKLKGATGKPDTDVAAKVKAAIKSLRHYHFVFVHIKAADSLAEDGEPLAKKAFIEKVDQAFAPLLKIKKTLIVVTADHTTSSLLKQHTADPVPLLMAGSQVGSDEVTVFGERAVTLGKLGHIQGQHLMPIILDQIGRSPIFGA